MFSAPRRQRILALVSLSIQIIGSHAHASDAADCKILKPSTDVTVPQSINVPMSAEMNRESLVAPQGEALLTIKADAAGKVLNVWLAKSSGRDIVDTAALDSLRRATFSPGTIKGKRAPMCFQFRYIIKFEK